MEDDVPLTLTIDRNLARFLEEQVSKGRFASTTEALEAGIARLMLDPEPDVLDQRDLAEIRESIEQMKRGEVLSTAEVRNRLRAYPAKP